jgi:hypothetical protein
MECKVNIISVMLGCHFTFMLYTFKHYFNKYNNISVKSLPFTRVNFNIFALHKFTNERASTTIKCNNR